jgi:RNA polymerase sigma-70 factor, ECF subfamily
MEQRTAAEFGSFYEQWFDRVYNFARARTGSGTRADEIASDVFARVLDSWDSYDPKKGQRSTWLFAIAFRSVADHFRSESRRKWSPLELFADRAQEPGPAQAAERGDEESRLAAALAGLDERAREVVSLKFFSGLRNREIAKLAGLTESNVAVILFRSIRLLRKDFPGVEA